MHAHFSKLEKLKMGLSGTVQYRIIIIVGIFFKNVMKKAIGMNQHITVVDSDFDLGGGGGRGFACHLPWQLFVLL